MPEKNKINCLLCNEFWTCKNRNEKYICKGYIRIDENEQITVEQWIDSNADN